MHQHRRKRSVCQSFIAGGFQEFIGVVDFNVDHAVQHFVVTGIISTPDEEAKDIPMVIDIIDQFFPEIRFVGEYILFLCL